MASGTKLQALSRPACSGTRRENPLNVQRNPTTAPNTLPRRKAGRMLITAIVLLLLWSALALSASPTGKTWNKAEFTETCADNKRSARCITYRQIVLTWNHPVQREDLTPLEEKYISHYVIQYEKDGGQTITLNIGRQEYLILRYKTSGTYTFRIATGDSYGRQSEFSDDIQLIVP